MKRKIAKWRGRFTEQRCDGLLDEPRPGRPRTISDDKVDEVVVKTLESIPKDATHWSTRSMAREVGLSHTAVSRIWRAFGLQPHRAEPFKLTTDPLFTEKVRDIVGLYLDRPSALWCSAWMRSPRSRRSIRSQPTLPILPGTPERASHDYRGTGITSLFAALDTTTGKVIGSLHSRHRAVEIKKFLKTIDKQVPAELDVQLVLDNYSTRT